MRHLVRGKRLRSGLMSDEAWCGAVQTVGAATHVADVDCVACLDAIIEAGVSARRRRDRLLKDSER